MLICDLQSGDQKMLVWPGIKPTALDLTSQLGNFDHSAQARQPCKRNTVCMEGELLKR